MWWHPDQFAAKRKNLQTRAKIIKSVRAYFDNEGFEEVQTPVLQIMACPDPHIHVFETQRLNHALKPQKTYGLHTSPEIAMKKLLVAGADKIFQICPVFRNAEHSPLHSAEFTMLEWYRTGRDYTAMMEDCEKLIKSLGLKTFKSCNIMGDWERLSVEEAFQKYASLSSSCGLTAGSLRECAAQNNIRTLETDSFEDLFHAIMAEKIEPHLGQGTPTILYDYPVSMAALARKKPQNPELAERFELYICGVELANAFSELIDPIEQQTRLKADLKQKSALYGQNIPVDDDFIKALEYGMPECTGCALGLDRLVMLACGADTIDEVLWTEKP